MLFLRYFDDNGLSCVFIIEQGMHAQFSNIKSAHSNAPSGETVNVSTERLVVFLY